MANFLILLLILQWTCSINSMFKVGPEFKNHTAASTATSAAARNSSTSASSAAAIQSNRSIEHDSHRTQTSRHSGSASARAENQKASSLSESKDDRNQRIVQDDDSLSSSIKHVVSHSTTQVLIGKDKDVRAELPSAVTRCESPTKCLAAAYTPTGAASPLSAVALADAEVLPPTSANRSRGFMRSQMSPRVKQFRQSCK